MKRFSSAKFLVAATLAAAALGAATVAEARPDVTLAIGFQTGPAWVEPAPVYVQPRPVYVQPRAAYVPPAPVYVRPPVYVAPRVVVERPRWRDDARFEWERERAWRHAEWRRHGWHDGYRGFDRDGDRGERKHRHDDR
ncbi:MAG TPA: hypothetical protein VLD35_19975 [Caldimonas sp.]|nr:hypothetical protein [Caldimonas sp.]